MSLLISIKFYINIVRKTSNQLKLNWEHVVYFAVVVVVITVCTNIY